MRKPNSLAYSALRDYMDQIPVIDAHEHYVDGTETGALKAMFLLTNHSYAMDDLISVSYESYDRFTQASLSDENGLGAFYDAFEAAYKDCRHTGYMHAAVRGLTECWGLETVGREAMTAVQRRMASRDNAFFDAMLQKYGLTIMIMDLESPQKMHRLSKEGHLAEHGPCARFAFPLAAFHKFYQQGDMMPRLMADLLKRPMATLDDYVGAMEELLSGCVKTGLLCALKDQQAYRRKIHYDPVSKDAAEEVYTRLMKDGHLTLEDSLLLSDYIMRAGVSLAAKYDLPMQLHTGHLCGLRNEISKANAVHLTSLINDFPNVHFDLFHGNWPYMGEYLFLGKNYPNVSLNLCWVHAIDSEYSIELMRRAVMTIPHSKLNVFGGDCTVIEATVGFLCQARETAAWALSDLVESEWLSLDDAREIACDWFYNNPNRIFKLGLPLCDWRRIHA